MDHEDAQTIYYLFHTGVCVCVCVFYMIYFLEFGRLNIYISSFCLVNLSRAQRRMVIVVIRASVQFAMPPGESHNLLDEIRVSLCV